MSQPARADVTFEDGLEARYAGAYTDAVSIFEDILAGNPENADAWVQLGYSHLALENYADARRAFTQATILAPDYTDAYLGLARLEWYQNNPEDALSLLLRAGNSDEAEALRQQILATDERPVVQRWRSDVTAAYRDLSKGLPAWHELNLALGYRLSDTTGITGQAQYARRFNTTNIYFDATLSRGLSNGGEIYATLGGAPDATFRPEAQIQLGSLFPVYEWNALNTSIWARATANAARYATGDIQGASLGLQLRLNNDTVRVGTIWSTLLDETGTRRTGIAYNGEWQIASNLRLTAGYSDSPETSDGNTLDVRTFQLGTRFGIGDLDFGVLAVKEERRAYDTTGLVVSVTRRF